MANIKTFIELYDLVGIVMPHEVNRTKEEEVVIMPSNAKNITLANYDPRTKGLLSVHNLSNYRRQSFSVNLLSDIKIPIDKLLRERKTK